MPSETYRNDRAEQLMFESSDDASDETELLGISEEELENQCDELFKDPPIKFKARKGNKLDEAIDKSIKALKFTLPIMPIKDKNYLIGP